MNKIILTHNFNSLERNQLDSGICSECGWNGLLAGLETEDEVGDYGTILSRSCLCPICEDGGCIDDFYDSSMGLINEQTSLSNDTTTNSISSISSR